ncbi:MAG TPA: acetylornithine deacetylase [Solirubrobacteraceae bacterium]|nr:acetylornithine deacetylase [Solirubrobacteraceae bacterium]
MTGAAEGVLADLVAFPTVAGTSNGELIDYAAQRLQDAGAAVRVCEGARPDAHNLHAVLGPADEPGLVLCAHTDVVAVDGQSWSRDPFVLHAENGRLYSRGTADMKGFIAALLTVAPELHPASLRRPVHIVLSSDEELGCLGIRPLLPALAAAIRPPALTIVGEPTRLCVVECHKGKIALRVQIRGRACHSSRAPEGVNAVEYGARLIAGLDRLRSELSATRDERFAVPHATVSTGPICGGTALNIVPDTCTFELEARLLPGQSGEGILAAVRAQAAALQAEMRRVAPEAEITVTPVVDYPALIGSAESAQAGAVADWAGTSAGGAADYGTEGGLLEQTIGGTVVVCGPGDMAQAHRADEFIEADQLDGAVAFLGRLVRGYCGTALARDG